MLHPSGLSCARSALHLSTNHSLRTCVFVYIKGSADRYWPLYSGWITKNTGNTQVTQVMVLVTGHNGAERYNRRETRLPPLNQLPPSRTTY